MASVLERSGEHGTPKCSPYQRCTRAWFRTSTQLGFDTPGAAVDTDQRFVEDPHVGRVVARTTAGVCLLANEVGQLVDRPVGEQRLDTLERGDAAVTPP
jgi:hypothetical protein